MDLLYIGLNGSVSAIDPTSGTIQWTTPLKTGALISATGRQDVSVLVKGEVLFAGAAGHLFCLNTSDGRVLWHNPLKGLGHNDVSLAMNGIAVQYITKVERSSSSSSS
jgi:outer membrane protein assembly factor BamB